MLPPSRSGGDEARDDGSGAHFDPRVGAGAAAVGGGGGGGAGGGVGAGLSQPGPSAPPAEADLESLYEARRAAALATVEAARLALGVTHEAIRKHGRRSDPAVRGALELADQAATNHLAECREELGRVCFAEMARRNAGIGGRDRARPAAECAARAAAAAHPHRRTTANSLRAGGRSGAILVGGGSSTEGRSAPPPEASLAASQGLIWRPVEAPLQRQVTFGPYARAAGHDEESASLSGSDASDTDGAAAAGPPLPSASTAGPGLTALPMAPDRAPLPTAPSLPPRGRPPALAAAPLLPPAQAAPAAGAVSGRPPSLLGMFPSSRSARPPQ